MKSEQLIKSLLLKGESQNLEFKKTFHKESVAQTVCGFLNTDGGQIVIGIDEEKGIFGIDKAKAIKAELELFLTSSIAPNAPVSVSIEQIDEKDLIVLKVWRGSRLPYTYDSSIFIRNSISISKAKPDQISELIEKRQISETLWERQSVLGVEINDLDEVVIRETIDDIKRTGRGRAFDYDTVEGFLSYYGLYQNGLLSNAAVILFAKEPSRFLPQSRVRLTIFENDKTGDNFLYDKFFEGNLFRNAEAITQFFDVNIGISSKFRSDNWKRNDLGFPKNALREGLLNALIHQDYSNSSGSTNISFYPDRLEISNYGSLPTELKIPDLKKSHASLPRNPDIAHVCFLREWIEKLGRGTIKIIEECKERGYPQPKWKRVAGNRLALVFPEITVRAKIDDTVSDAVNDTISKEIDDTISDTVSDTVKERLITVVQMVKDKPGVRIKELVKQIDVSEITVKRDIQKIKALVSFKGSQKTGGYFITNRLKKKLN